MAIFSDRDPNTAWTLGFYVFRSDRAVPRAEVPATVSPFSIRRISSSSSRRAAVALVVVIGSACPRSGGFDTGLIWSPVLAKVRSSSNSLIWTGSATERWNKILKERRANIRVFDQDPWMEARDPRWWLVGGEPAFVGWHRWKAVTERLLLTEGLGQVLDRLEEGGRRGPPLRV